MFVCCRRRGRVSRRLHTAQHWRMAGAPEIPMWMRFCDAFRGLRGMFCAASRPKVVRLLDLSSICSRLR